VLLVDWLFTLYYRIHSQSPLSSTDAHQSPSAVTVTTTHAYTATTLSFSLASSTRTTGTNTDTADNHRRFQTTHTLEQELKPTPQLRSSRSPTLPTCSSFVCLFVRLEGSSIIASGRRGCWLYLSFALLFFFLREALLYSWKNEVPCLTLTIPSHILSTHFIQFFSSSLPGLRPHHPVQVHISVDH